MKKRASEAALIFIVLIALFAGIYLIAGGVEDTSVQIDGTYYSTGESEISLTLMTEEGLDELSRFVRLKSLKVIPYKAAVINSLSSDDEEYNAAVRREAQSAFDGYTDIEDISFIKMLPQLTRLDVSYCAVSDISPVRELTELTELNLAYTSVADLSPLAGADSITELVLTGIPAEDLSPLLEMKSLARVKLSEGADEKTALQLRQQGVITEIYNDKGEQIQ